MFSPNKDMVLQITDCLPLLANLAYWLKIPTSKTV